MADLHAQVLELLKGLNRVVRTLRMYAATHPQVQKDMDACFAIIQDVMSRQEALHLGVTEGMLVVEGKPVKDDSASFKTFAELLRGKHIGSFKITRGTSKEEFLELVRLLCMRGEDALEGDAIKPELLRRLQKIKVNEIRFAVLSGDEADASLQVAGALAEAGVRNREDVIKLLDGLYQKAEAEPEAGATPDGSGAGATAKRVLGFFDKIGDQVTTLERDEASQTVRHYFEALMLKGIGGQGVQDLQSSVQEIASGLTPEMQQMLFGEPLESGSQVDVFRLLRQFDSRLRSEPIMHDLLSGQVDVDHLRKAMDLIAPAPAEFVKLYEQVAAGLMEAEATPEVAAEAMSRLFKSLKLKSTETAPTRIEGTVLVCDPVEIEAGGYPLDLEEMGFTVIKYLDGRKVWEHVRARGDVQCLIMDVKIPGKSGLEILNALTEAHRELPVVIITQHAQFQDAFEVASYPRLRYLLKPVDLDTLRSTLLEFIPQREEEEEEEEENVLPEEMKRAQEIQEKLIPTEPVAVPGYDISFYYKPALAVGGDYVDFIQLDDHRTGFVIADVSGKNITGAMVMVMVRSVFHMVARMAPTALETAVHVNEHVTRDIRRGMFVSAVYAILDTRDNTLRIVNCGHNPALTYTREAGASHYLPMSGTALGLFSGPTFERSLREDVIQLEPGDRMFFYTDGVVEAMSPENKEFTDRQLLRLFNANATKTSRTLVQGLVATLDRHRGTAKQSDDITMVSLLRQREA